MYFCFFFFFFFSSRRRHTRLVSDWSSDVCSSDLELHSDAFGLFDPLGGRADLARQRLRVLHPLSYVEDPTRLFRAARYATRFGLAPDAATARAQTLALRLAPYAALSGQRIVAELERILVEPHAAETLARLGRGGAFRLLDPRYRFTAATGRLVTELPGTLAWARQRGLGAEPVELGALALTADQPSAVASAALERHAGPDRALRCLPHANAARPPCAQQPIADR